MLKSEYKQLMLLVTECCNLNCTYCYEHEKNPKKMSFETARKILDNFFADITSYKGAVIEFFGGEAFLNFELIKAIDEYIITKYPEVNITFENTTNGTLIHGEIQRWLSERKDRYDISLSLDGTKEMHDRNRRYLSGRGSFDDIDFPFFLNTWPGCAAKMTVSEQTLPQLAEGVEYLESLGFDCLASLAIGNQWDYEKNAGILISELEKLVDYYGENPGQKICQLLQYDFRLLFYPLDENFRYCGAGVHMVCFDTEGKCYPCQGFAEVSIGEKSSEFLNYNPDRFAISDENPCRKCKWIRICRTCYAANFQATGNIQRQCSSMCLFNRLCILASSKIQFDRLIQKKDLSEEDQMILKGIAMVQNEIMDTDLIKEIDDDL